MKKLFYLFSFSLLIFTAGCSSVSDVQYYSKYLLKFNSIISFTVECTSDQMVEISNIFDAYDSSCDYYNYSPNNLKNLNTERNAYITNELKEVLEFSLTVGTFNNSFNMYSGSINNLWKEYFYGITTIFPNSEEVERTVYEMNNSQLEINGNYAQIIGNANIDLGAVAKGYAVMKVEEYLEINNIKNYLINAGNSNISLGEKSDGNDFQLAIKNVYDNSYALVLSLSNKSVVTSSIEGNSTFIDDVFYSHIIDPTTGYSNDFYDSITLIGDCSATLDILSTSFFNLSLNEIKVICDELSIDIVVLKNDEILYKSEGVSYYEKDSN